MPARVPDPVRHVFAQIDAERARGGPCWLWTGARQGRTARFSYGQMTIDYQKHFVHRLMYAWAFGPIPEGMVVRHTCDTPQCCNPFHLILGTQADNMADMSERGRASRWRASLTHCKRGHAFTDENTRTHPDGSRSCRECENARRRKPGGRGPYQTSRRRAA